MGGMMQSSVIDLIGNTPLLPLRKVVPPGHARVLVKLEQANPTGSMKDRAALAIVRRAAQDARLPLGATIVECTSGSTGTSLASVAVAMGYKCLLVSSDASSAEKLAHMQALGAELQIIRSDNKKITAELVKTLIETSRQLSHPRRAGQHHTPALAALCAGTEPGRKRLGLPARKQTRDHRLRQLRRHPQSLLHSLELLRQRSQSHRLNNATIMGKGQMKRPLV